MKEIPVTDDMERAFGIRPVKAVLGLDLICVFETEDQVRTMKLDQEMLNRLEGRIQRELANRPKGRETDCVSRSFCPKLMIAEDPVSWVESAHCRIADYWSERAVANREILVSCRRSYFWFTRWIPLN